jgi:hypothetical protein
VKLTGFAGHLSGKYSLDAITEKEKNNILKNNRLATSARGHS